MIKYAHSLTEVPTTYLKSRVHPPLHHNPVTCDSKSYTMFFILTLKLIYRSGWHQHLHLQFFLFFILKYKHFCIYSQMICDTYLKYFFKWSKYHDPQHMFKLLSHSGILNSYYVVQLTCYRVQQFNLVILNGLKWIIYKV